jgi:hypothetical protein
MMKETLKLGTNEEIHCTMQYAHVEGIVYFVHYSFIHFQTKLKILIQREYCICQGH